ncbi:MAG: hypothetical protein NTZ65_00820 [Candidatus Berkelbacteria bacterium]|nr:hypothetical protein [Candidatus Berkelbacteria bacterium]
MLDSKAKEMMTSELGKLGIKKDQVDDYMIWGVKKLMLGVMKIKWSLKENGIEGKTADEQLKKIVDKVVKMDADDLHEMMHKNGDDCDWKK